MSKGLLNQVVRRPGHAIVVAVALLKGHWYKFYYPLRGRRFRAGKNLRVFGRLSVRGPGEVVFGDDVSVHGHATPWTYAREARIEIGDRVIMGPARFGCAQAIVVGADSILASSTFTDTDFHSTRSDRRNPNAPIRVAPVRLERNVWIGTDSACLPGTTIGENSVVGFGAVCMRSYPANVIILGNPGRVVGNVAGPDEGAEECARLASLPESLTARL